MRAPCRRRHLSSHPTRGSRWNAGSVQQVAPAHAPEGPSQHGAVKVGKCRAAGRLSGASARRSSAGRAPRGLRWVLWPAATRVWAFAAVHGLTVGVQKQWNEVLGGNVAEEREECEWRWT